MPSPSTHSTKFVKSWAMQATKATPVFRNLNREMIVTIQKIGTWLTDREQCETPLQMRWISSTRPQSRAQIHNGIHGGEFPIFGANLESLSLWVALKQNSKWTLLDEQTSWLVPQLPLTDKRMMTVHTTTFGCKSFHVHPCLDNNHFLVPTWVRMHEKQTCIYFHDQSHMKSKRKLS